MKRLKSKKIFSRPFFEKKIHFKSFKRNIYSDPTYNQAINIGEFDGDIVRVNNVNQYQPVHYFSKNFATDELIKYYEQRIGIN